ncbi:Large neutral amino acids transporter small subunit 4 [Micractinium conductrix]|uniref:Large neutral amino acids transporter small subunit 4 n=1 Tax=Micractinium conductrix TaxID=554055 RepID=A0A2P6VKL3_9CHLO|nr:Large neutral amino acids transporter small subunit 4 [Micractinium conductrix]|eukprot:PSC74625.1 Large neutral amino acids transporter small subunit 4 [Micractinium conductrix]
MVREQSIVLPAGTKDARVALLVVALLGEFLQGGLMFGWPSLSGMLKDLNNFEEKCPTDVPDGTVCTSQESSLALLWTLGIFTLNCGPVAMGFVLDFLGPKLTGILGVLLNMSALVLFGVSSSWGVNAFIPAAILLGLGNITFHLAQFHISALFPRSRGMVASVFVAGFTGCGIVMYLLMLIFESAGGTQSAYRTILLCYAGVCSLWIPLLAWMMPSHSFRVGMVYLKRSDWTFEVRLRTEFARQYRRTTSLQDFVAASAMQQANDHRGATLRPGHGVAALEAGPLPATPPAFGFTPSPENGLQSTGPAPPSSEQLVRESSEQEEAAMTGQLPQDISWGPLVFEARRFVELRKKTFSEQFWSTEALGMGIFYTLNVFIMQFYLGTTRLQLANKGDNGQYTDFANIVVAFAVLAIPIIGWLLDKKGYGITLGTINGLNMASSILQAVPNLQVQVLTIITWMIARFFMYSSYFAIFGNLFGFKNFGKLVATDNVVNSLFGLLQYPLTQLGLHHGFTWINTGQAVVLLPLFIFAYYMYRWENADLVPIRPMEGEELEVRYYY